jgi:hypothetical protein
MYRRQAWMGGGDPSFPWVLYFEALMIITIFVVVGSLSFSDGEYRFFGGDQPHPKSRPKAGAVKRFTVVVDSALVQALD